MIVSFKAFLAKVLGKKSTIGYMKYLKGQGHVKDGNIYL